MQTAPNSDPLPTLVGDRVLLRLPVPSDIDARLEIPRDLEENRMYGGDGEPKVFSRPHGHARFVIGIFDRRFWSHGYGTEAIRLILRYGFESVGLHRVDLVVLEYNLRAIRSYEKCGFVREGVLRETIRVDGVWRNDLVMAILESEYRAQPWATTGHENTRDCE